MSQSKNKKVIRFHLGSIYYFLTLQTYFQFKYLIVFLHLCEIPFHLKNTFLASDKCFCIDYYLSNLQNKNSFGITVKSSLQKQHLHLVTSI